LKKIKISNDLQEKIYDLKSDSTGDFLTITTYFPLKSLEIQKILKSFKKIEGSGVEFNSIFSDDISEQAWMNTKEQIKKKFQDDLLNID
jgi:hypothetical protein